jgi:hypothetical protein
MLYIVVDPLKGLLSTDSILAMPFDELTAAVRAMVPAVVIWE